MKEKILHILGMFPFLLSTGNNGIKLNGARILEGILIAAIAGLFSGYISVQRLEVKIDAVEKQMIELTTHVNILDNRLYEHNKATKGD